MPTPILVKESFFQTIYWICVPSPPTAFPSPPLFPRPSSFPIYGPVFSYFRFNHLPPFSNCCSLQEMSVFLRYANYVFTAVFIIEGVLKIYALGFKKYIKERYIIDVMHYSSVINMDTHKQT